MASELERRWEEALRALKQAEVEGQSQPASSAEMASLDQSLKDALLDVGRHLPELWQENRLSRAQKKAFLRSLIDKVVIRRAVRDRVETRIVWRGGAMTEFEVPIAVNSFAALHNAKEMESRIIALVGQGYSDKEAASCLTAEGFRSPRCTQVIESTVRNIRLKHKVFVDRHHPRRERPEGYLPVAQAARLLGVEQHWIYYQIRSGHLEVSRDQSTGLYLIPEKPETMKQLEKLKAGEVENVRL